MSNFILIALLTSISSFVYQEILTQPGMIFNGLYNLLNRLVGEEAKKYRPYLWKPLIGCPTCVAGQFGFWGYLIKYPYWIDFNCIDWFYVTDHVFNHALFISFVIFSLKFISKAWKQ